jgi:UDP-GlcNAc:undecaprenyl-phosphate GlcNAc-1-phosphate transferase
LRILLFILPAVAAALLSFVLTPLAERIARAVGAIDVPDPRKVHLKPTPRMGGLAVIAAVGAILGLSCAADWPMPRWATNELCAGLGLGILPILIVSIRDDIRPLRALPKFVAQAAGAAIAVWMGVSLGPTVHVFGQSVTLGIWAIPISVLWLVGVTNAFNLIDGLDGLSAGMALISAASLSGVFLLSGQKGMAAASLVLAGALIGFLPYNFYPARIFLGDTGSAAVGFCLACFSLRGGATLSAGFATLLPVLALGLPVAETLISIARRVVHRLEHSDANGVFEADRNHIHHRLLALGIDHRKAVLILYGAGLVAAGTGLLSVLVSAKKTGLLLVALLLAGFVGMARLGYDEFALIRRGLVLRFYDTPVLKKSLFVVFVDICVVCLAVYGAVGLRFDDWDLGTQRPMAYLLVAIVAPVTVGTFWAFGLYRGAWRLASVDDFVRASAAAGTAAALGFGASRVLPVPEIPFSLFGIFALLEFSLVNGSRASYRVLVLLKRRSATAGLPCLIYGAGQGGVNARRELESNEKIGLRPVGFLDDDPEKHGRVVNGLKVFGSIESLPEAKRETGARVLVVASWKIPRERLRLAKEIAARESVEVNRMQISLQPLILEEAEPASPPEGVEVQEAI